MNVFVGLVPLHYYLFRSIYGNLENSCFIIPPMQDKGSSEYGGGMSGNGLYSLMAQFLKSKKVEVADYGDINIGNFIKYLSKNADNIICPHMFNGMFEVENTRIFKIVYGIPNENNRVQFNYAQNFIVDMIFTFGAESSNRFKESNLPAIEAGNPMFDNWFNGEINETDSMSISSRLDKSKQTILYLPTHSNYSSFDKFIDEIINLSYHYNVVVKVHHMTFNGEIDRLCKLVSHPEVIALGDYFDPLPLYKVADVVLTDTSGALFDAILLNKPTIMLQSNMQYKVNIFGNGVVSLSDTGIVPYTEDLTELKGLIKANISKAVQLDDDLMHKLYYQRDGKAGQRIAEHISENVNIPLISTSDKYKSALKKATDIKSKNRIVELKENYLNRQKPVQQTIAGKIKSRLSYGRLF